MHAKPRQRDIIRESDPGQLQGWLQSAEAALQDHNYSPREQRERHDYYMQKAAEIERLLQGAK